MSHILQATSFQSSCLERNSGKFSGDVESLQENDPQSKGNVFEVHEIPEALFTLKIYKALVHVLYAHYVHYFPLLFRPALIRIIIGNIHLNTTLYSSQKQLIPFFSIGSTE